MTDERLDFKQMCARFEVTPRTLRHYEYIELLQPERDGRARYYGAREIARMTLIRRGRRFGFSLEEVRQWLELYDADPQGATQAQAWTEMADRQLQTLRAQRDELGRIIAELQDLRDAPLTRPGTTSQVP